MIGLIAHTEKSEAAEQVRVMIDALTEKNLGFLLEKSTAELIGLASGLDERALARECGLLVVLGGDGTILRVVHKIGEDIKPIFGINIGSLGFLTCAAATEIPRAVDSILRQDYILSQRSLLLTELISPGGKNPQNVRLE